MKPMHEELVETILSRHPTDTIEDVRIGLGYTAVKLDSGACGVACTLRHRVDQGGCALLAQAGTLGGTPAADLVPLLASSHVVEAALGLASINALANTAEFPPEDQPLTELLHISRNDRVGMVGYIEPIAHSIRQCTPHLIVFDEAKSDMPEVTEVKQEASLLPQCDVVILSATTLLNHTFDTLVGLCSQAHECCLLGPSTPILPECFRTRNIGVLAGRRVLDAERLLQIVSEAGGTRHFKSVTQKVTIRI